MIIDFHTHVFPPKVKENRDRYIESDPCFSILYSDPKSKLVTTDELITSMDRAGVNKSVILNISWASHELCLEMNDYILESISRYPQRLIGFCGVCLQTPEIALKEIKRCIKGGAKGIGELRLDMQSLDISDRQKINPLIETIKKHNLILLIHSSEPVGHIYPGKGTITPSVLYRFIANNPEITIICSHWGGGLPFYALMPEVKRAIEKVYFDTAASPLLYSTQIYKQVLQLVGDDKILFGSDFPLIPQDIGLKEIELSNLTEDTKKSILAGNALRLLNIN